MRPEEADSPCKRLYLAVQLMYLSNDPSEQHSLYFQLTNDIIQAAPSTLEYMERMNNQILTGAFYKALKEAKELARVLTKLPQTCMRNDRLSLLQQWQLPEQDALLEEMKFGLRTLNSGETLSGAKAFSEGKGRHGSER